MFNPSLKLGRREFLGVAGVSALALSESSFLYSCSTSPSTLITEIQDWLPTVTNAVESVISVLSVAGIVPIGTGTAAEALIETVSAAVTAALAAVNEYINDPAADKATLWGKIKSILAAIADNITTFISALNLSGNPVAQTIATLVGLIINTISGFIGMIPTMAKSVTHTFTRTTISVGGTSVPVKPKALDKAAFIAAFNSDLGSQYQKFAIH